MEPPAKLTVPLSIYVVPKTTTASVHVYEQVIVSDPKRKRPPKTLPLVVSVFQVRKN